MTTRPVTTADIDTRPPLDLEPIRVRCELATPGPWRTSWPSGMHPWEVTVSPARPAIELDDTGTGRHDAAFIAHARTDLPALVAEVERLRARLRGDQPVSLCEWCEQPVTVGQAFAYQPGTGGLVEHTACATPSA